MSIAAKLKDTQRLLAEAEKEIWCLNEELKAADARIAELEAALRRAVSLADAMMTNDPNEPVSDAGHTCLDLWRAETERLRAALEGK